MIYAFLALIGLALGSFINATVWRLHTQSSSKKKSKHKELSVLKGRSLCEHCGHQLSAVDLVPVASWLFLKGRCRYCRKSISWQHPLTEGALALLFVISYLSWPFELIHAAHVAVFSVWLIFLTIGFGLALYDLRWMILPNRLVYPFIGVGLFYLAVSSVVAHDVTTFWSGLVAGIGFSGFFYALYQVSGGRWIGGGDVRLAVALGVVLGWEKTILGLSLAAYLGTLVVLILVLIHKYHRKMKLPFGPFLLSATYISMLWGQVLIDWYLGISGVK